MRKKRNVTLEHATMECADNASRLADTGYTHTHTHTFKRHEFETDFIARVTIYFANKAS